MLNSFWWSSSSGDNKGIKWLSWDAMSFAKCKGGLGFRNLHGFNLSLLGKHCWKFMHQPQALVSRVYKERYFADSHLNELLRAQERVSFGLVYLLRKKHWLRGLIG